MAFIWLWGTGVILGTGLLMATATLRQLWRYRKVLGKVVVILFLASSALLTMGGLSTGATILLVSIQAWFVLLGARLWFGRLEEPFLRPSTINNTAIGFGLLAAVGVVDELVLQNFAPEILLGLLASLSAAVALLFLRQALWTFRRFALPKPSLSLKQLPSVSVCVPARNEDHELAECIAAVLRSDYPKLEALVLDDCSQDKTADIIKSFAHDGVRFVQGDEPATGWLGKNQAMNTLAEHASGQWLLFLSADSQLGPGSISQLVHYALAANKQMLSVLPQNLGGPSAATLLGTLQYYWQIVFPITKRRVPVSGKAWFIQAKTLKKLGGFDSVKHKIIPEGSFARRLFAEDAYRFFVSDARLALTTSKNRNAQIRTSIRLLYPTFKRQPMFVLFGLFGLSLLLLPFCVVVLAALWGNWWLLAAGAIALTLLFAGYVLVVRRTQPVAWLASSVCLPLVLAQEMVLCVISMLRYEFSEVSWKGRNVCYPVISGGRRSTPLAEESTH